MTWNSITILDDEFRAAARGDAKDYLRFLTEEKGIPIGPDYLVEIEVVKDEGKITTWTYRWRRKDGCSETAKEATA